MTGCEYLTFTLKVLFETLEVETQETEDGGIAPLVTIACEDGLFVPMYARNDRLYSFKGSNGADYSFTIRERAEVFLKVYGTWFNASH